MDLSRAAFSCSLFFHVSTEEGPNQGLHMLCLCLRRDLPSKQARFTWIEEGPTRHAGKVCLGFGATDKGLACQAGEVYLDRGGTYPSCSKGMLFLDFFKGPAHDAGVVYVD